MHAGSAVFVLERPDGPCGIAAGVAHTSEPAAVFLVSMWAAPAVRGTGAADLLVAAVLDWARARGARTVCLHVTQGNERARAFYLRNGFRVTGEELIRQRDGAIEIEMRRPVSPR